MINTTVTRRPLWWTIHDVVVGVLAGFGLGSIAGLFLNRGGPNNYFVLIGAIVGVLFGVYLLIQNHRRSERFITSVVVLTWVVLVASALFLTAFIVAVLNFN